MTTAGDPLASLGPRYAPEDPTLPKPWKGLVDGSSGVLYYWNPESNITQYERPANLDPMSATGAGIPTSASAHTLAPTSIASSLQSNVMSTQHGQEMSQIYQSSQGQQMFQQNPGQFNFKPQHQSSQFVEDTQHQGTQMTQGINQQGPQIAQGVQQNWQSLPQQSRDERAQQPVQRMPQHLEQQTWKHFGEDTQFRGIPITQQVHQQGPNMSQGVQQNWQSLPQQSRDDQSQQSEQRMPQHLEQKTWPHFDEDTQFQGPPITQEAHQQDQKMSQQNLQPLSQHSRDQLPQQPGQRMPQYLEQQTWQHEVQKPLHMQGQQFSSLQPHVPFQGALNMQGKQMLQPPPHQGTYQQGQQIGFSHRGESEFQQGKENGLSPSTIQQPGASFYQHHPQTGNPSVYSQQYGADSVHQPRMGRPMFHGQSGSVTMHGQQPGGPPMDMKMGYGEDLHGRPGGESYFDASKRGSLMVSQQLNLATSLVPQKHMSMEDVPHLTSSHGNRLSSAMTHNAALVPPPVMRRSLDRTNLIAADVYRREHEVTATGDNVPAPFMTFEATGFPPEILREIHIAGFTCPTPIQAQTWPISLQSRDIVAIAKTGSGKTLGYLVPAFLHLRQFHTGTLNGPRVLILAPTRELATQIQDEAIKFGRSSGILCTCLYGGAPKGAQIRELDRGVDIVVATPGRLNDILEMRKIDFRQVSFLVLDEADRMLDMGFEPQIRKIVNEIPPRRQTLMYTATWPKEVRKIAADLLVNPVQVNIGRVDELAANKAVKQYVEVVPQMNKQRRLEQILRSQEHGSKVIIFCSTKRLCDQLTRSIGRIFGAAAIHGDKSQGERDHVLNQFRSGKSPILVATDVAARGLDIKDVRMVINYDFPTGIEDYVHRIGRTGRAGATGVAYTFFSDQDRKHAADLVKVLEGANQTVPPELLDMTANGRPSFVKNHGEMPSGDSGGGRMFAGGRGGMRDGNFAGRGGMRDGSFAGHGGMRDGNFAGHGGMRDGNFAGHGGMRDSTFTGRSGQRDGGFGGYRGRDDFGGHGNRGRGFSGTGLGPGGWGRHDSGPREHHNNDRRGKYDNRRGLTDGSRGRNFRRNYSRSPDMVSTWDTRSSSSDRSRSRSRSRSRNRSRSRSRSRGRSRSRSIIRNHARSRNRSCSRSPGSSKRSRDQDHLRSERVDPPESKISTPSPVSLGDPNSGKLVLSESSAPGGSIDENSGKLVLSESSEPGGSIYENSGKLVLSESSAPGGPTDETMASLLPAVDVEHNIV